MIKMNSDHLYASGREHTEKIDALRETVAELVSEAEVMLTHIEDHGAYWIGVAAIAKAKAVLK